MRVCTLQVAYVKDILPEADGKVLVLCIGVTSGVGRLAFGKIGDLPRVNRVVLQQGAFFAIGVSTMLLTLADSFAWLVVVCLLLGLFDGCFVSLVGPIAFDLCGAHSASQAIGFLLGLYSLPMTTGPTVAGQFLHFSRPKCRRFYKNELFFNSNKQHPNLIIRLKSLKWVPRFYYYF